MHGKNSPFTMSFLLYAALLAMLAVIVLLLIATMRWSEGVGRGSEVQEMVSDALVFDCESTFPAATDHQSLARRFGPSNVIAERVSAGEGTFSAGSVLFPADSSRRVEILWKDTIALRNPSMIRVRGNGSDSTSWRTADGITIGSDLRIIAGLNTRPFMLTGFEWDYSGTVMSWDNGRLQKYNGAACDIRMRLAVPQPRDASTSRLIAQVSGSGTFSSAHPTMQRLNPRVYELFLRYR